MLIRESTQADLTAIRQFDETARHDSQRLAYIAASVTEGESFSIVEDNTVAGYLIINQSFFHRTFLSLLYIDQAFRDKGLGRRALRWCRNRIGGPFFTSTNLSNARMIHLLRSEGFLDSGIIYNLDQGDPELVFYWDPEKSIPTD